MPTKPIEVAVGVDPPPIITAMLKRDADALDPEASKFLPVLKACPAPFIWHKHGSFYDHLHDVWEMMSSWGLPQSWCRLGLFHSAYSNSYVCMNAFDPNTDREKLQDLIGKEAENLVYKFCVIDRQALEDQVLKDMKISEDGYTMKHIRSGELLQVSSLEAAAFMMETVADYLDQSFSWQTELEAGNASAQWPGIYKPTTRMSKSSKMAWIVRESGHLTTLPPIFNGCTTIISPEDEKAAVDEYWSAVGSENKVPDDTHLDHLEKASKYNPFVGEPHLVRAQILCAKGEYGKAEAAAKEGLTQLYQWATNWDKRMPFNAWVSWGRCMLFQATLKEWPASWGGMESLGAVDPSQRFRGLNSGRKFRDEDAIVVNESDTAAQGSKRQKVVA